MFKTAIFKVHNPSNRKRRQMLDAMEGTAAQYAAILDLLKDREPELRETAIYERVNPKTGEVKSSNSVFNVQKFVRRVINENPEPFPAVGVLRESFLMDACNSVASYLELSAADKQEATGFPSRPVIDEPAYQQALADFSVLANNLEQEKLLSAELSRVYRRKARTMQFHKYDEFPLLRTPDGKKMYALLDVGGTEKSQHFPESLVDVRTNREFRFTKHMAKKKILLPLELGRWHLHQFFGKGTPAVGQLTHRADTDEFYVNYSFSFEAPKMEPQTILGIHRSRTRIAVYAIIGFDNAILCRGDATQPPLYAILDSLAAEITTYQKSGNRKKVKHLWRKWGNIVNANIHSIANEIVTVARANHSAIAFADLNAPGKPQKQGKRKQTGIINKTLKKSQYNNLLKAVTYKAEYMGVRVYPAIHPAGTFITCPDCGIADHENIRDHESFICTYCAYTDSIPVNSGALIAIKANYLLRNRGKKSGFSTLSAFIRGSEPV